MPAIDCKSQEYALWSSVVYVFLLGFVIGAPILIGVFLWYYNRQGEQHDVRV